MIEVGLAFCVLPVVFIVYKLSAIDDAFRIKPEIVYVLTGSLAGGGEGEQSWRVQQPPERAFFGSMPGWCTETGLRAPLNALTVVGIPGILGGSLRPRKTNDVLVLQKRVALLQKRM